MGGSERIRELRKRLRLTQETLASLVGVSRSAVISWEKGSYFPEGENLSNLATILETSTDYLLGKTDDPRPVPVISKDIKLKADGTWDVGPEPQKKPSPIGPDLKHNIISMDNWVPIPVLDINTAACAGCGNGLCGVTPEASEYILVDPDDIGPIDDRHRPFCIRVEGDSMEGAGIPDGSMVVINPAIEVSNGAIALVVFDDLWMVKGIVRQRDGSVELRSSNPNYAPVVVEPEMATDDSWIKVIGPVMEVVIRRKPGRVI